MSKEFPIHGIPEKPGVYESEQFPLSDKESQYAAYYKYPDGTFFEDKRDADPVYNFQVPTERRATQLGPFRRIGDLEES